MSKSTPVEPASIESAFPFAPSALKRVDCARGGVVLAHYVINQHAQVGEVVEGVMLTALADLLASAEDELYLSALALNKRAAIPAPTSEEWEGAESKDGGR